MTQVRNGRDADMVETVAHVRQVLGSADPLGECDYTPDDERARSDYVRIIASRQDKGRRRVSRRWAIVAGALVVAGAVTGMADATGILPTGVMDAFRKLDDPYAVYGRIQTDRAQLLVQASTREGAIVQMWEAPTTKGGWCAYNHIIRPGKHSRRWEFGGGSCGQDRQLPGPEKKLYAEYSEAIDDDMSVYGRAAPPAVKAQLTLSDGTLIAMPINVNGYFMTIFDPEVADRDHQTALNGAKLRVFDSAGKVLATKTM